MNDWLEAEQRVERAQQLSESARWEEALADWREAHWAELDQNLDVPGDGRPADVEVLRNAVQRQRLFG